MAADDPKSLDAMQKAVNDAATKASLLWTSLITLTAYLLIAAGSVKHRDLFLGTSIKLPVLGVDLPVTGFFLVAPLMLLVLHFYLVLLISALRKKVDDYNPILRYTVPIEAERRLMRHRLDNFLILQLLADVPEQRAGRGSTLLLMIAWMTAAIFPLLALLQMQVVFLPYHDSLVTWLQRICIIADLGVIQFFWRTIHRVDPLRSRAAKRLPMIAAATSTVAVLAFSLAVATYPGEFIYRNGIARGIDILAGVTLGSPARTVTRLMFEGDINTATGQPKSLFSNRIILPNERFFEEGKHRNAELSVSFRGRDLRGAIFQGADLRKADFSGAKLSEAVFTGANLKEARFRCPIEIEITADVRRRGRERCNIEQATDLRSANFTMASAQGASFDNARLHGARFTGAMMQGASFDSANLTATYFGYARVEGASFANASASATSFIFTQAQGADFSSTEFTGAALLATQFQGANLGKANLAFASLNRANIYRAHFDLEEYQEAIFSSVSASDRFPKLQGQPNNSNTALIPDKLDAIGYELLQTRAADGADDKTRGLILARLSSLNPKNPPASDQFVATHPITSDPEIRKALQQKRFAELADIMCAPDDAPFVARGMIDNGRVLGTGIDGGDLITRLRDPGSCPGARGLNEDDHRKLRQLERQIQRARQQRSQSDEDEN